mmetsp:Transcript_25272/g.60838  ORF Transcript_25272/g.60838 Transcript_25272/m.60838 type:complete len:287 (+) Transcript_25272:2468-3328(+)
MSSIGTFGMKSFPTNMHITTKSSTIFSKSYLLGSKAGRDFPSPATPAPPLPPLGLGGLKRAFLNSMSRYCRRRERCRSWNSSFFPTAFLEKPSCFFGRPKITSSRSRAKWGSCVTSPSMMRSASRPYMQWRRFGGKPPKALMPRMYIIILCSPSPGMSGPDRITWTRLHEESSCIFFRTKYLRCLHSLAINSVPGVMQFESKTSFLLTLCPSAWAFSIASSASFADLNRLCLCWFIFARGATPSTAMKRSFLGDIRWNIRSMYSKILAYISSSVICSLVASTPSRG